MLEYLKLSQRFLSLLSLSSFLWILVFSFCSDWMFLSSFCFKLLLWVPRLWDFLGFLEVCFLHQMGKFSFIIFSNKFSISCCFSSPSGTPMIWMLEHLKLSWRFLRLTSFFWILVSSFCSGWMFLYSSGLHHWFESRFPNRHRWFPVHFPLFHFA